jgi:hypothetical protein
MRRLAGRFLLEQQLRVTAGADVWLALDEKLNRSVAVYLMSSGTNSTSEVLSAARLAAGVPDTRFVQVLDAVDDGISAYVVTEWLTDAVDLATRLADGPMAVWEAAVLAREVSEAMVSAHGSGLTHLRLDPYNVLRTESGQVKIHGLRLEAVLSGVVPASDEDARTADVRGIGALLYASLTAHWPWGEAYGLAPAPHDALGPVPPVTLRGDVPPDVDSVTMRLLSAGVPLPEATPPAPAPRGGDEETLAVPRLPVATCVEAVEALSGLRSSRPQPPTPPQSRYPVSSTLVTPVGGGDPQQSPHGGYQPNYRYGPHPGPDTGYDDTGIIRHGPGVGNGHEPGSRRALAAVVAVLVLAGAAVLGWKLTGRNATPAPKPSAGASTTKAPSIQPLPIVNAVLYQSSTSNEHAQDVANTIDGKAPAWTTFGYKDGPKMVIKPGTGIIYDLGAVHRVSEVHVRIGAPGATVELQAADPGVTSAPTVEVGKPPAGFTVVDSVDATTTDVKLTAKTPVRTRFVLVWFTALPNLGAGGGGGPYHDSISLVKVYGSG